MTTPQEERGRAPNGRSSIYEGKDGWWHGWVTMGVKPDGKPDRRHRKARSEAEVTAKVQDLERKRDAGRTDKPGRKPTVAQWMNTFLTEYCQLRMRQGKMGARTLEDYQSKARNWIIPLLGAHRLDQLRLDHLQAAYAAMYDEGLAHGTVVKVHRIVARALKIAMTRDLISRNVADLVEMADDGDAEEVEAYNRTEVRKILAAAKGRRNAARWSVAFALGLRQGEALGLRRAYVIAACPDCLETHPLAETDPRCPCGGEYRVTVRAWHQVQRSPYEHGCDDVAECARSHHKVKCRAGCKKHHCEPGCRKGCKRAGHNCIRRGCPPACVGHASQCPQRKGGGWVFTRRKGKKKLTIACPAPLVPVLREHLQRLAEEQEAAEYWEDHDLVFPGTHGQPVERNEDWRQWKALLRAAGVREGRVHDARHTAASLLVEQGVHLRTVQEVLGHARVTTTQRYAHVAGPLAEEAADRMGAAILV